MADTLQGFYPRKPRNGLIVTNVVLLAVSMALITIEWVVVTNRQAVEIGKENRFLTTEWYLLQQLRAQTDAEIRKKDQEIAGLKRLYEQLRLQNEPLENLAKVEGQLRKAETDREEIVAEGLRAGLRPTTPPASRSDFEPVESSAALGAFQERLKSLAAQNEELRIRAETAETALKDLRKKSSQDFGPSLPSILATLETTVSSMERETPPSVDELKTHSLVRAILSSAEVTARYPELLGLFDRYRQLYGTRERTKGRLQGYEAALQDLRDLGTQ